MGYRHILAYDHVLGADARARTGWRGYDIDDPFHEVFVLFGFLAAVTRSVELVTGVLILPQRQTALVAKRAAEVDVLSGGRLRLGIGVGWNPVEYGALREEFGNRGLRSEEQNSGVPLAVGLAGRRLPGANGIASPMSASTPGQSGAGLRSG
jgi:alkanesulfonate monooxygenase SsuD/methylene tetrahydromethanopterin reductase-like flavin-dependent oxidoreductase (luciferase family)